MEGKSSAEKKNCIGAWNVRSMNQGKLEAVKQEMAKGNISILGISELKWAGEKNLIQVTITSTIMGKNPLEEMEQTSQATKEYKMQFLSANSKVRE